MGDTGGGERGMSSRDSDPTAEGVLGTVMTAAENKTTREAICMSASVFGMYIYCFCLCLELCAFMSVCWCRCCQIFTYVHT